LLYSREIISFDGFEKEVCLYLKNTRNQSFRITAKRIVISLPASYKNPQHIAQQKEALLLQIRKKISEIPSLQTNARLDTAGNIYIYGSRFEYYPKRSTTPSPFLVDFSLRKIIFDPSSRIEKKKFIVCLCKHYTDFIVRRVGYINQITVQGKIREISLRNNQSSWGLCSASGDITLSVSALFAPLWVLDYIIVHELCHLIHLNHSAEYWSLVARFYPEYKQAKKALKENGNIWMI
jgi:predicted metal-dependent hydrolase